MTNLKILILIMMFGTSAICQDSIHFKYDAKTLLKLLRESKLPTISIWDSLKIDIRVSDIPYLISMLDSKDTCANVCDPMSSYADIKWSTVGHESAFMIQGFRSKKYPPYFNSRSYKWKKQEILNWWRKYKK